MKKIIPISYVIVVTLLFGACQERSKSIKKEPVLEIDTLLMPKKPILNKSTKKWPEKLDFEATVGEFMDKVLGSNERRHDWGNRKDNIQHLELFDTLGLQEIIAFSDQRYPQNSEPNYYEHFVLFALKYENEESAKRAYQSMKVLAAFDFTTFEGLDAREERRIRILGNSTKSGGLIYQKYDYVFSLVETCRNPPVDMTWEAYENLFLHYMAPSEAEVLILNANCGYRTYLEERRRIVN